jgi:phosphoserine phosphatase
MTALHIFDMDGTLLRGTTASLQVSRALGGDVEMLRLEERLAAGSINTGDFAVALRGLWSSLSYETVYAAFENSPWMSGIESVCSDIRRRGEFSMVITMSPDFFARNLLPLGFDAVIASKFPALPFTEDIDIAGIMTHEAKISAVENERRRRSIAPSRCIAYGDSRSDVPLFQHLNKTVAINGDDHIVAIAKRTYLGDSMFDAYLMGRSLLSAV